ALGHSVAPYYPSAEAFAEFGQQVYPAVAEGRVAHFERQFRRADGTVFWANFYARLVDVGQPQQGIIVIIEDIDQAKRQEESVRESEERYRQMFENNTSIKLLIDPEDGAIVDANPAAAGFYGYPLALLRTMNIHQINELSPQEVQEEMALAAREARRYFNFRHRLAGGEVREVEVHSGPLLVRGRRLLYSIIHDVTARKRAEEQLKLSAKVFEGASEGILICDRDNRIMSVNRAFTEITGYSEAEVRGRDPRVLNSGRHDTAFFATLWHHLKTAGTWQGEVWNRRKDGEIYPEWLSITTVWDEAGAVSNYVAVFADISERKRHEERIRFLAEHDFLTGLPNRSLLHDRLEQAVVHGQRSGESLALLFLDLDRFKNINDSLGHHTGDALLQEVGRRIQTCVRGADTVSRPGGDEFVILLSSITSPQDAARVAEKLLSTLTRPYQLAGHELVITASIGIAVYPEDGEDFQTLLKNADAAMYYSKEAGRNSFHFFTQDMNARVFERLSLENSLRRALERQEFLLHYQPQVDLASGRVIGFEALIRWQHPELGLVPPLRFIPIAEDSGLIVPIGEWVLQEACRQNRAWQEQGMPAVPVAVNISVLQFRQPQFETTVAEALESSGLPPAFLELELTESMMLHQGEAAVGLLDRLKARGVQLSIDDFGTGYSSLAYLKRLPLDKLKIDQAFVRDIATDPDDAAITATIIQMAHNLGLAVIAEGVETEAELAFLQRHACGAGQGYHFARPMPAAEVPAFWQGRR
ncbi:MAG TPA: EAL domain-containing protein, partial [Azospira sp.]|nr:EAL domain-containing protein [Azospira sp.]